MRWKWQLLKLSSIWVFTIGITLTSIVFIGMFGDGVRLGRNDILILSAFAGWAMLLAFVHYVYVLGSTQLLRQKSELQVYRIQAMLVGLLLNLLVLAGWIFAGVTIVQIFREAQPGDQTPTFALVLAMLIFLTIAIAVANYLLAINAYFELQHVRRKQQEDILHAIGNPHFQHHS